MDKASGELFACSAGLTRSAKKSTKAREHNTIRVAVMRPPPPPPLNAFNFALFLPVHVLILFPYCCYSCARAIHGDLGQRALPPRRSP